MLRPLLLDACIAITFGAADRLDLITGIGGRRVLIAAAALEEVRRQPARDRVRDPVRSQRIDVEGLSLDRPEDRGGLVRYDSRPAFRGRADAEVLALAELRGYVVASDERAIGRAVVTGMDASRIATTLDILLWAIRDGRLNLGEAEGLLHVLDSGPGVMRRMERVGRTLRDLA